MNEAPGRPGNPARWTSSAKSGLGVALSESSRVWFTISHGIINEVYYPRVDQACLRDLGLIVTDGENFFAEEKRECEFEVAQLEDGVPAYELTSTHREGRFRIIKHVIADPRSDSVLMRARLEVLTGPPLKLYALAAPHLVNRGAHNTAWVGDYKGAKLPFASGEGTSLALAADAPFAGISVGFVGVSDGWRQLSRDKRLVESYDQARDGNVAITVELALDETGTAVLAIGFGTSAAEAAFHAVTSIQTPFDTIFGDYASGWRSWQAGLRSMERRSRGHNLYRVSTAVLRCHETPTFPGGFIASLSIPWGSSKGDDDLGGYHLVWPRDLCETAGAFLACGAFGPVRRILRYLRTTQEAQGSWAQNCWLDGSPYWAGMQLDECAFPLLLLDMAMREGAIRLPDIRPFWPMVKGAAGFVLRNGPRTRQDRWEENAGYTPFTLAVAIAGLLSAGEIAQMLEEHTLAELFRETADAWNEQIEDWVYVKGGSLDKQFGVAGHYIRVAPVDSETGAPDMRGLVQVKNHEAGAGVIEADALVSTDALALVRFGLRSADDPRIQDTVKVIDETIKVDLPQGAGWRRYNLDGYGEKADGSPFNGTGIGRVWPLLAGERAHYELAAGRKQAALTLLQTIEAQTSAGGLMPEQVWDGEPIPDRELAPGEPSGSAMPLVWAHSEYIKLLRSLADGKVFDTPFVVAHRYLVKKTQARVRPWREDSPAAAIPIGHALRLDLAEASIVLYTRDGWATQAEVSTSDSGIGLHIAEVATEGMKAGEKLEFTWRRTSDDVWRGQNFVVETRAL